VDEIGIREINRASRWPSTMVRVASYVIRGKAPDKYRDVGTHGKSYFDRARLPVVLIIVCDTAPNLSGSEPNHGVGTGVVFEWALKHLDPERPLFEHVPFALESHGDDISK